MKLGQQADPLRSMTVALTMLLVAATASVSEAQDRMDRWEFGLGLLYQVGSSVGFDNGALVDTDDDFGIRFETGYNFTDNLAVGFGLQWAGVSYTADTYDDEGVPVSLRGSYDSFALFGDLVYYFGDKALAPYISGGIGWTWIDTNVPNGPPSTGCWWDPWWGWVCYTSYPTKTTDAFSYQVGAGFRYEFNFNRYLDVGYTSQWVSLSGAEGTPRFNVVSVQFGWLF